MHTGLASKRLSCARGIVACRSRLIPEECSFSTSAAFIAERERWGRKRSGMPPPAPHTHIVTVPRTSGCET